MATFDATLGGAAATSYVSVATADAYYTGSMQEALWQALSQEEQEAALMAATSSLETLTYAGTRCSPSSNDPLQEQALQWPRSDATCKGIAAACTMLPKEIVQATCYLALELHTSPPTVGSVQQTVGAIASQTLGALSISYHDVKEGTSTKVDASAPLVLQKYPVLVDMLGCWSDTATGSGRVVLRVRS